MADTTTSTFEPPAYKIGSVHDQRGWMATGAYDYGVTMNSQDAPASFGQQSFRISSQKTSGSFGDWAFSREAPNEAGEASNHDRFIGEFSFLALGGPVKGSQIAISPDRGDGSRMSYVRLEDSADGVKVVFIDYATVGENTKYIEHSIATLDRETPHTVKFDMRFIPGASNDVVKIYIDGKPAWTGTSWEDYFRYVEKKPSRNVSRLLFRAGGTAADFGTTPAESRGFLIDNVTVGTPDDQGPAGATGATGQTGATGATGATGPAGVSGSVAAAHSERSLVGDTRRVIRVKRRDGERLVSVRATLKGKQLKVGGRKVTVDLRGRRVGVYNVRIAAKYVGENGKVHVVLTTRQLRVTAA